MSRVTDNDVIGYIANAAESMAEDDLNEDGYWTDEEHEELIARVMKWCRSGSTNVG